jgi:oligoendopeptidase F
MLTENRMTGNSASGITWDLSDLFSSSDDPRIDATLSHCQVRAQAFSDEFRPIITDAQKLNPQSMLHALKELEELYDTLNRVGSYASLLYGADTSRPEYQDLEQKVEQRSTEIRNLLIFVELEWLKLDDQMADPLMQHAALAPYQHYLKNLRRYRPYMLSEPEERLLNERDNTGRNAFGRLFSETTSSLSFTIEKDGAKRDLNLSQILSLLHHQDRALRRGAMEALYDRLAETGQVLTFVYDTLIQDNLTIDRLRGYQTPIAQRHLSNEIDPQAAATMIAVTEENYGLAQEYFRLKAELLGLPRLALYDQYAPVGKDTQSFPYARAQYAILEAFDSFDPNFRAIAAEFFAKNWIDAEIRNGKRGGAFCASPSPRLHPYILCNYDDSIRDVMTVAHELGHGLHGCLSRKQNYFNYDTPLTTAETASVFAEMLVFDYLLARQTDRELQIALLASKIEDILATVFRQNVLTRFEELVFASRKEKRLTPETVGNLWLQANSKYYGNAVEIPESYRWGWSYIPHFIHSRFYCYSYVFGQLLVLALYRMYKNQGRAFVPKYLGLLAAGGSDSPELLLKPLGVDINQADFWRTGFDEISGLLDRLRELRG